MRARDFLTREECTSLTQAVVAAENKTSGEIRIHIESKCSSDPRERALRTFHLLNMSATAARNAVLIYVASSSRKMAVIGDKAINEMVPQGFWKDVCDTMASHFSEGRNAEGLRVAVSMIGDRLKESFPYLPDDVNELPDEISFGEDADD